MSPNYYTRRTNEWERTGAADVESRIEIQLTQPAVGAGSAKQAVRKDSDPSITVYNQGVELMLAKRSPEAQAKFEQAVRENPRFAEAHNNLGYTLRKQGAANFRKSLEHYNRAIELKPKLAEAYLYRGVLYTFLSVSPGTPGRQHEESTAAGR